MDARQARGGGGTHRLSHRVRADPGRVRAQRNAALASLVQMVQRDSRSSAGGRGGAGRSEAVLSAHSFFAVCPRGLQDLLALELQACGARSVTATPGGAGFDGTLTIAYAVNLHSRLASRVLWRVAGG